MCTRLRVGDFCRSRNPSEKNSRSFHEREQLCWGILFHLNALAWYLYCRPVGVYYDTAAIVILGSAEFSTMVKNIKKQKKEAMTHHRFIGLRTYE